jgi:neutral ceramidase
MEAFGTPVIGSTVKSFHFFKDMQYFTFPFEGSMVQTCPGALGFSFGAGTTDGPGLSDFMQGSTAGANSVNPFWKIVSGVIRTPSQQQKACQGVKPILLDVGEMALPYAWTPNIVDIQLMRVGQLVMIVAATEATTMAGRRWRNAVSDAARTILPPDVEPIVVLGGPANTYTHYATTPEEYDIQRYEGASTLYGRYTLPAYINLTTSAIGYLSPTASTAPPPGPPPPDHRTSSLSFIPGVVYDNVPLGKTFGQVLDQPSASYARGAVVSVRFQAANPRNNLRLEETYAAVEQLLAGKWVRVRDDSDWFLEYTWARANAMLPATSEVTIKWATSTQDGAGPGTYRVLYYGDSKAALTGKISAFVGTSNQFTLV